MSIVVIGSINVDYNAKVARLPEKGETILASSFNIVAGGKGANQAIAAGRLGGNVHMIGTVGHDTYGMKMIEEFNHEKINTKGIKIAEQSTGMAMVTVDEAGSNTIVVCPGANDELSLDWINQNKSIIKNASYAILQLEIPMETVEFTIKVAKESDVRVILNPAPVNKISKDIYPLIDILTPNETEIVRLTGEADYKKGARKLLGYGVKEVIVTLGSKGCYYLNKNDDFIIKGYRFNTIDTTAAGDSFNGALAVALTEGKTIKQALLFANAVGGLTTTKIGASKSLPYRKEVEEYLSRY